ncbi:MAG: c-type cytochrome [Gammaproteobacteria bacterium]|jgi:cbb3-type cytochrome c oxidase subunit III
MIKRITSFGAILGLVLVSQSVHAEQVIAGGMDVTDGDPKAGKTKSELCHGCHGADGMSVDPTTFPNLAGQYAGYIFKQVQDFQLGNRHDDTMSSMAQMVTSKQDLKDIAVYFQSQKKMKGKPTNSALAKNGKNIFENGNPKTGVYGCVNCHGKKGKGKGPTISLFPVIGGQTKAYLVKQLNDLKSGKRSNDPAGMMAAIAKKLSDKEIQAVAEYLSGL